jgi:membrane protein required for colicin V production
LSTLDIVLGLVILLGAWKGYKEGFLMGFFTLLALVLGVLGGFKLCGYGIEFLQDNFNADHKRLPYLSFFIIFIIIVTMVIWMGKSIRGAIDKTFLGRVDEIAGTLLGAIRTVFVVSTLLWILYRLDVNIVPETWTNDTVIYPLVVSFTPALADWVAGFLPFLDDIFQPF